MAAPKAEDEETKAVIKIADMDEAMQVDAVDCAKQVDWLMLALNFWFFCDKK